MPPDYVMNLIQHLLNSTFGQQLSNCSLTTLTRPAGLVDVSPHVHRAGVRVVEGGWLFVSAFPKPKTYLHVRCVVFPDGVEDISGSRLICVGFEGVHPSKP